MDTAIKASTEGWGNEGGPGGGAGDTAELQALDPWKVTGGTRGPSPRTPGAVCVCVLPRGTQWPAPMPPNTWSVGRGVDLLGGPKKIFFLGFFCCARGFGRVLNSL